MRLKNLKITGDVEYSEKSLMYFLRNCDVSTVSMGKNARKNRFDKMRILYVKNNGYAYVFDVWGSRWEGRRKVVEIKKHTVTYAHIHVHFTNTNLMRGRRQNAMLRWR